MTIVGRHWICGLHDPPVFVPVVDQVTGTNKAEWRDDVVANYPFLSAVLTYVSAKMCSPTGATTVRCGAAVAAALPSRGATARWRVR